MIILLVEFLLVRTLLTIRCVTPLPSAFLVIKVLTWVIFIVLTGRLGSVILSLPSCWVNLFSYYPPVLVVEVLVLTARLTSLSVRVPIILCTLRLAKF